MSEAVGVLLGITVVMAVMAAIIGCFYGLIHSFLICPRHLRWHYITAIIWTLLTTVVTICILANESSKNIYNYLALFVAGSGFIPSWVKLIGRWHGEDKPQTYHTLPERLLVQTLWGPIALLVILGLVSTLGQGAFENAVLNQDLPTALSLRKIGIGDPSVESLQSGLMMAVEGQDADAVRIYMIAGVPKNSLGNPIGLALQQKSTAMTEVLLRFGEPVDPTEWLHQAIRFGNVEQVRLLLKQGADRTVCDYNGETPLQVAKHHGNKEMIALLREPAK